MLFRSLTGLYFQYYSAFLNHYENIQLNVTTHEQVLVDILQLMFLCTFLGSVLMLVSFIYLYNQVDVFSLPDFMQAPLSMLEQQLIFVAFLLAFAVKVPMWPVHTWLPDAHVEAPTGGSVILAAIMLKMGGYGFIRLSMPITQIGRASCRERV